MAGKSGPWKIAPVLCLLLAGLSPSLGYRNATAADAVPSPLQAGTKFPQISQVIDAVQSFSPELVAYIQNPKTVCTIIAPDNKANMASMTALGRFSGLVLQNQSLVSSILNYHVIPDRILKAEDLGTKIKAVKTRQGEPMYFTRHGGVPYVADGKVYVQPIEIANIQAGGCLMHIVDETLMLPPSLRPTFHDWMTQAGNASALQAPKSLWLTDLPPVDGTNTTAPTAAASSVTAPATQALDSSAPADSASKESGTREGQNGSSGANAARASLLFVTFAAFCAVVLLG